VTDPPSVAGARIRALGYAALAAGAIRRLGRVPRPQVPINGIRYKAAEREGTDEMRIARHLAARCRAALATPSDALTRCGPRSGATFRF
jgi:hypothetical protein